ncbi:nuclear transport factor 2 family protein [Sphingomonas sp. BK235]|uniref:nuclear transport factor 2 family protein n=1 Tax=Sphingomonas sp. BK235 TaxID=2512131 RepID=UPI001053343F|nr:nuclear transport factor 2 family protein [Sphingomonas sp. BK235]TCP31916.1 hypothetical protein EV292_10995 [Sphingomonas sp. BK235]
MRWSPMIVLAAALVPAVALGGEARADERATRNRALVAAAFERWAAGQGDVFALLADDATWRVMGSDPAIARTYHGREALLAATARPLAARLSGPLVPTVRRMWAESDDVLVEWSGSAPVHDGTRYANDYLWIMTLRDGRITAVTAYLDVAAFAAVLAKPARPGA